MKKYKWLKILLSIILVPTLLIIGIRGINTLRYPAQVFENSSIDLQNMDTYPTKYDDIDISRIEQNRLNGFHIQPKEKIKSGIIVTLGGPEGGCGYFQGIDLAKKGYEVFSLFYFGQKNQPETLSLVPLEFFQDFLQYVKENNIDAKTITLIGGSNGAELALLLTNYYEQIDNVVLYAPSAYVFQGLTSGDYQNSHSSWTYNGKELPYVSFRAASSKSILRMFSAMLFNYPISFFEQYNTATENADNIVDATISSKKLKGHMLIFAGEKDAVWPSVAMGKMIKEGNPKNIDLIIYKNAGHTFSSFTYINGVSLGGSIEANEKAKADSDAKLLDFLNEYHKGF